MRAATQIIIIHLYIIGLVSSDNRDPHENGDENVLGIENQTYWAEAETLESNSSQLEGPIPLSATSIPKIQKPSQIIAKLSGPLNRKTNVSNYGLLQMVKSISKEKSKKSTYHGGIAGSPKQGNSGNDGKNKSVGKYANVNETSVRQEKVAAPKRTGTLLSTSTFKSSKTSPWLQSTGETSTTLFRFPVSVSGNSQEERRIWGNAGNLELATRNSSDLSSVGLLNSYVTTDDYRVTPPATRSPNFLQQTSPSHLSKYGVVLVASHAIRTTTNPIGDLRFRRLHPSTPSSSTVFNFFNNHYQPTRRDFVTTPATFQEYTSAADLESYHNAVLESSSYPTSWSNYGEFSRVSDGDRPTLDSRNETFKEIPWPVKKEAVVEGDLIIGGLMMVHEREDTITCGPVMPQGGIQALEAMLYTLDHLNFASEHALLPNITLGAHILDDCDKDTYGLEMAVDFIKALNAGLNLSTYLSTFREKCLSGTPPAKSTIESLASAKLKEV